MHVIPHSANPRPRHQANYVFTISPGNMARLKDGVDAPRSPVLGIWLLLDIGFRASPSQEGGENLDHALCFDKDFTSDPTIVFLSIIPVAILGMIA